MQVIILDRISECLENPLHPLKYLHSKLLTVHMQPRQVVPFSKALANLGTKQCSIQFPNILVGQRFEKDDNSLSKAVHLLCRQSLIDKKLDMRDSYFAPFYITKPNSIKHFVYTIYILM